MGDRAAAAMRRGRALSADKSVPKWVKAMLLFGFAPVPGPLDEVVLLIAVVVVVLFFRGAWVRAGMVDADKVE